MKVFELRCWCASPGRRPQRELARWRHCQVERLKADCTTRFRRRRNVELPDVGARFANLAVPRKGLPIRVDDHAALRVAPRRARPGAPTSAASPQSTRSYRLQTESPPTGSRGAPRAQTPAGRRALEPLVKTCVVVPWTPSSQEMEPPGNPGRFRVVHTGMVSDWRESEMGARSGRPEWAAAGTPAEG